MPPSPADPGTPTPAATTPGKTSGLALASLILGVLSLVCGIFTGLPAVFCGHIARFKIHRSGGALTGKSVAFSGFMLGYVGIFFALLPHFVVNAREQARRAEAKVAVVGISAALRAYYTEYGKYPLDDLDGNAPKSDILFGAPEAASNARLFNILRAVDSDETKKYNPRMIVFFNGKSVSDPANPRNGFVPETGAYIDLWGHEYRIAIDANYDSKISNLPYTDFQGANAPAAGVAAFSLGKDGQLGTKGDKTYGHGEKQSDDIISWQ